MIKFLLLVAIALTVISGAIQFESTDERLALVVNKERALNGIPIGAGKIYDFVAELINDADKIKGVDLTIEK